MKIKNKYGETMRVFVIYLTGNEPHFLAHPPRHRGLVAFTGDEIEIVDDKIDSNFVFSSEKSAILHESFIRLGNLLEVLEGQPDAFEKFMSIVGET